MSELSAGRELDALVAERVFGVRFSVDNGGYPRCMARLYSTDIAAAWEIPNIRRVHAPGNYTSHGHHPTLWHAYCGAPDGYGEDIWEDGYGETAPLAICRAALKATGNT